MHCVRTDGRLLELGRDVAPGGLRAEMLRQVPLDQHAYIVERLERHDAGDDQRPRKRARPIQPFLPWLCDANLAEPSLCVVPDVGNWSAPRVMAHFTGVIHDRQRAADPEHNHGQDDQQGDLHGDLANAGPPTYPGPPNYRGSNEPNVNAPAPALPPAGRPCVSGPGWPGHGGQDAKRASGLPAYPVLIRAIL